MSQAAMVKPSRLSGGMPIVPLLYTAGLPAIVVRDYPTTHTRRPSKSEPVPCLTCLGVLNNSSECPHCPQCVKKTSLVISQLPANSCARAATPVSPPALTRRMGHNRMRPRIRPRIPILIPRINALKTKVAPIGLNVESCDLLHLTQSNVPKIVTTEIPRLGQSTQTASNKRSKSPISSQ